MTFARVESQSLSSAKKLSFEQTFAPGYVEVSSGKQSYWKEKEKKTMTNFCLE